MVIPLIVILGMMRPRIRYFLRETARDHELGQGAVKTSTDSHTADHKRVRTPSQSGIRRIRRRLDRRELANCGAACGATDREVHRAGHVEPARRTQRWEAGSTLKAAGRF